MLVQFCFFGAYAIVSLPAGMLIKKIGYQNGAVTGLVIAACGCALFYPASMSGYALFLLGFFVLAAGITILQVAANPYVTVLGDPRTASSRLSLTQAFNSLGTTIAPILGGILIAMQVAGLGWGDATFAALFADAVSAVIASEPDCSAGPTSIVALPTGPICWRRSLRSAASARRRPSLRVRRARMLLPAHSVSRSISRSSLCRSVASRSRMPFDHSSNSP